MGACVGRSTQTRGIFYPKGTRHPVAEKIAWDLTGPGDSSTGASGSSSWPRQGRPLEESQAGGAFELQLKLDAGTQVLTDRALRKIVYDSELVSTKQSQSQGDRQDSAPASRKVSKQKLVRDLGTQVTPSVVFGADLGGPPEECRDLSCKICFSTPNTEEGPPFRFCGVPECEDAFCTTCFGLYATGKVMDALHFAPPIRCPGCRGRVRTAVWTQTVEPEVRCRYRANAAALLTVRCAKCDEVSSLLQDVDMEAGTLAAEQRLLGDVSDELRDAWASFETGGSSADELLEILLPTLSSRPAEGEAPPRMRKLLAGAAALVQDEERRVSLQLAALRRFPKIRTPCCNAKICFKCKVAGWHNGISCESRQRRFIAGDSGVQSCPKCGVPTQRTEGCLQVQCVCGCSWQWKESEEEQQADAERWVPLPLVCLALPSVELTFLQSLIGRRADLTAVRRSDRWTASHFASLAQASGGTPLPSDASRLEALESLWSEMGDGVAPLDFDAADVDGDTPLCVAVAHDNVAAVKFLLARGAILRPSVVQSLHEYTTVPRRLEMREALRPFLATADACDGSSSLALQLELGNSEAAVEMLARGCVEVDEEVARAFVWRSWSSEDGAAGAGLVEALEQAAGPQEWMAMRQEAATKMIWKVLESGWPAHTASVAALRAAVACGADVNAPNDKGVVPLGEALERQQAAAVEYLVESGAAVAVDAETMELSDGAGPFGPAYVRATELMHPEPARPMVAALAPRLEDVEALPLWVCVQFGLEVRARSYLEQETTIDSQTVVSVVKRALLGEDDLGIAAAYVERSGEEAWQGKSREAATSLLLLELRLAFNFERDPDLAVMEVLLKRFGADPSALPSYLSEELQQCAELASGHGERLSPLMLLAVNTHCSPASARSATALLLEYKADPNQPDEDGDSALLWALLSDNPTMAELLAKAGAALSESALDYLQGWCHPGFLRPLADALAPQLASTSASEWPDWFRVQFGLPDAEALLARDRPGDESQVNAVEASEEELAQAVLLSSYCGGDEECLASALEARLGEEAAQRLWRETARMLLNKEVSGAYHGKWTLDHAYVTRLLDRGVDVNMLTQISDDLEEEDDDSEDEEEEEEESAPASEMMSDDGPSDE